MELKKWFDITVIACIICLFLVSSGWSGLILSDTDGSKTLISEGRIKNISADPDEHRMIINLKNGDITIIDRINKSAFSGSIDEYCAAMQKMREMMTRGVKHMKRQGISDRPDSPHLDQGPKQIMRVERVGSGGNIAGYATQKYEVHVNGELVEEVWSCPDKGLLREIGDMETLIRFQVCSSGIMCGNSVVSSPEYQSMLRFGWMLRSVEHANGSPEVMVDVRAIEAKPLANSAFEVPASYSRMSLGRLFRVE
jgi:hypothetical protein